MGRAEPAPTDDRGGANAEAAIREHHHLFAAQEITNAVSESINSKIQRVKYTARDFRNRRNFVHAIYFHCGGLDLAPGATK